MKPRVRVKICGITTPDDALRAVALGADYLGLNFYWRSPRKIDLVKALAIRAAVGVTVPLVGVFVDAELSEIKTLVERVPLDLVQLHGNEPPELVGQLGPRVIKAFPGAPELSPAEVERYPEMFAVLFDSPVSLDPVSLDPGSLDSGGAPGYGGSGRSWDFERARTLGVGRRVFVAGGIGPDNVRAVLGRCPDIHGIDVCSRVEHRPGRKDHALLARLFSEVRDGHHVA